MPPATGTHTGVWHPAGNEQGPAATTESACAKRRCALHPGVVLRDARSAGHGATGAARPERSLQAGGFASGMEARQGGDSSAGSVHDSPPRLGDARESHKQERNGKKRKKKNSNHRNITSGKNIPDTSQTGRVTGDAPAWPVTLPAGASLQGGSRGLTGGLHRLPLYHLFLLPCKM